MVDFEKYDKATHPLIKVVDDYNSIVDHAFEKPCNFLIRYNPDTLKYEAIYGDDPDQSGKIYGTPNTDPVPLINDVFLNGLTSGRTWFEKVSLKGSFTCENPLKIPDYSILDLSMAKLILGSDKDKNVIENYDLTNGNEFIKIIGGVIDGERGSYNVTPGPYTNIGCGILAEKVSDLFVLGVSFKNCPGCGYSARYGYRHYILFNNLSNCCGLGNLETTNVWNVTMMHNILRDGYQDGINLCGRSPAEPQLYGEKHIIAHNICHGFGNRGFLGLIEYAIWEGNISYGNDACGMSISHTQNDVINNYCYLNQREGMVIKCTGMVANNFCIDNSQESDNGYSGMTVEVDSEWDLLNQVSIINNVCGTQSGVVNNQKYGIEELSGSKRNIFIGNRVFGNQNPMTCQALSTAKNNQGYNPIGIITNPFGNDIYVLGDFVGGFGGTSSSPTASTLYVVQGTDIFIKATSQTGGGVKVYAPDGTTEMMDLGTAGFDAIFLPIGYKINFGAFTVAPTVTVIGN